MGPLRRLRPVLEADLHRCVGRAFGCQLVVGLLHVRLLAEASVLSLRHERAAPCLGTPAAPSSATRLSEIDRFPDPLINASLFAHPLDQWPMCLIRDHSIVTLSDLTETRQDRLGALAATWRAPARCLPS